MKYLKAAGHVLVIWLAVFSVLAAGAAMWWFISPLVVIAIILALMFIVCVLLAVDL